MRDGNSFSTRRVHAIQYGKTILSMIASFQAPADGLEHQDQMPAAPDPEMLPSVEQTLGTIDHPAAQFFAYQRPIDLRHVEGHLYLKPGAQRAAQQSVWLKAVGSLPDDPLLHAAVLAYASDYSLLESVLRRHGLAWSDRRLRPASLDHAMWLHRAGRAAAGAWRPGGCSPPTAPWSPPWRRRACSASRSRDGRRYLMGVRES
jgi:acyl-CoA thioesterase-2